jgi:hypothetical protein
MTRERSDSEDVEREIERLRIDQEALAAMLLNVRTNTDASTLSIDQQQLDDSRETLFRKRQSQTAACLPRTAAILKPHFFSEYRSFAGGYQPNGSKAILDEAIAFARYIQKRHVLERWKADAVRYDLMLCRWKRNKFFFTIQRLTYDIPGWSPDHNEQPRERSLLVIAWRFGKLGKNHLLYRVPFF